MSDSMFPLWRASYRKRLPLCISVLFSIAFFLGTAPALQAATATASWDPNPEPDIAGYKLSYGTAPGTYTTTIDVGNVTTWPLTLSDGQRYYFIVQAYNASGVTSAPSAEVIYDVPPAAAPSITSLSRTSGTVGTSVTITGTNFGATKGTSTVKFNGTTATPTSWSATSIVVPVPTGATTGNVVVSVGGAASNGAFFRVTVPFTDDPLIAAATFIKAVHITELQTRIDAIRAAKNLAPFAWSNSPPMAGVMWIRVQHIMDLRAALTEAYVAATRPPPIYTDPVIASGMTIKAAHITELRSAVIAIE